jgi:hypothetical protein
VVEGIKKPRVATINTSQNLKKYGMRVLWKAGGEYEGTKVIILLFSYRPEQIYSIITPK